MSNIEKSIENKEKLESKSVKNKENKGKNTTVKSTKNIKKSVKSVKNIKKSTKSTKNKEKSDIKKTSREITLEVLKVERAIENYRAKNKLIGYCPSEKQLKFHKCLKRNRWIFGGNRSGKSECGAVEAVWLARGVHPYRENRANVFGWVVSPTLALSRDVAQNKVLSYLNPDWISDIVMQSGSASSPYSGVIDFILIKNVFGGVSKIGFKSAQMGREKFQGASLDFVWFDEEPSEDIYDECRMRLIDKKGEMFGTMTPLKGLTFVYNRVYLNEGCDDQTWHTFMEWADNPYLDANEIESMSRSLSEDQLQRRRFGRFTSSGGLVYSEFDENVHVIEPFDVPKEWYDKLSIDPGLNNPLSCHWYAVDYDNNIYVLAEHYERGKPVEYHAGKIWEISRSLGWHCDSFGRLVSLIDSSASSRTLASEKSVVDLFLDYKIQVNPNVNKDIFSGISRVKQYFLGNYGKIFIFKNCVNLIRELKSYWWGLDDIPKKRDDHALDELRYYIMSKPELKHNAKIETEIQKDKKSLIKKLKNRQN